MDEENQATVRRKSPVVKKTTITVVSLLAGLIVTLLSFAVERWLEMPKTGFLPIDLTDQIIAGIATSAAVYFVWQRERRAQLLDRHRFELINASTQQIRSALRLITDSAEPGTPQHSVVEYAVDHIEWVLQEVLPAVHQDPKEVRRRVKEYSPLEAGETEPNSKPFEDEGSSRGARRERKS